MYNTKYMRISLNIIDNLREYKTVVSYYYIDTPCNVCIVLRFNNVLKNKYTDLIIFVLFQLSLYFI